MENWENKLIADFAFVQGGYAFKTSDYVADGIPLIRISNVGRGKVIFNNLVYLSPKLYERAFSFQLDDNDILIGMTGDLGKVCKISKQYLPALLNQRVGRFILKNDKLNRDFLYYILTFDDFQKKLSFFFYGGAQANIRPKDIENIEIKVPSSIWEQQQIAKILNTIDKAIEQTEILAAKYQRIKTGLMQDLLTRGIDEQGDIRSGDTHEFKDSPLGKFPKEWEIISLNKVLIDIEAGKSPDCPDIPAGAGQWGVLKVSAVRPEGFQANENKVLTDSKFINPNYEVKHNDLLISRSNTKELVGIVCLVKHPPPQLLLCDKTLRLKVNEEFASVNFLFFVLQTPYLRSQIEIHATGSSGSMKNISQETIRSFLAPLPGIAEQNRIVKLFNDIDINLSNEGKHLSKLQKIKTGLMQDLLTGKVRVQ